MSSFPRARLALRALALLVLLTPVAAAIPRTSASADEGFHSRIHFLTHDINLRSRWTFDEHGPNSTQVHLSYREGKLNSSSIAILSIGIDEYVGGALARRISANLETHDVHVTRDLDSVEVRLSVPAQDCSPELCTEITLQLDIDWVSVSPMERYFSKLLRTDVVYPTDGEHCRFIEMVRQERRLAEARGSISDGTTDFTRGAIGSGEFTRVFSKFLGHGDTEVCL